MSILGDLGMEMEPGTGYYFPPRRIRAGRVIIALRRSKTALTVIPRRRKGSAKSQMKGYRMSAKRARGQQTTKRISHKRNLTIREPPRIPVDLRSRAAFSISRDSIIYTKERTGKVDLFMISDRPYL
jgi:hypothetical protein